MFVPQFLICKIETKKRNPLIRSMRIKQATFAKCLMFVNVLLKLNVSCIPGISALGRLRQEICKFEASLGYIVRLPQNKTLQTVVLGAQEVSSCPLQEYLHCTLRMTEALAGRPLPGSCREQLSSCWARWAVTVNVLVPPEKASPPTLSSLEVVASCS